MADKEVELLHVAAPKWDGDLLRFDMVTAAGHYTPYFKCEMLTLTSSIEASLLMASLAAMREGTRLTVGAPVSGTLLQNINELSRVFSTWFSEYQVMETPEAETYLAASEPTGRVGSFFTGGVDSFYTFIKHQAEITDLIYVHGYDLQLDDYERRHAITEMGRSIAAQAGIRFIEIETDSQKLFTSFGHWGTQSHGIALGVAGRLLAGSVDKIYVPSSFAQEDLMPWGSHPDTDPLLSDERLQFVHDGCEASRVEKIEAIKDSPWPWLISGCAGSGSRVPTTAGSVRNACVP